MQSIKDIAKKYDIDEKNIINYGDFKAKLSYDFIEQKPSKQGKLVLVTAINPTPLGEGKTTITIGLGDALNLSGHKTAIAVREPSLGPTFGVKGGAIGGGLAKVVPEDDINLHFTGDIHAITSANNLLCAMLDNHIHQGNELKIDIDKIIIKRCLDINDRVLRNVTIGRGADNDGVERSDSFQLSVACEIMAALCLAENFEGLENKLGNILVAYSLEGSPIFSKDLKATGALTALLKDAFLPNIVQTLEGTIALVHGGPFANIAHGANSLIATKTALNLAEFVITEGGFGSDLGFEKFMNIKCRKSGLCPSAVVLVATLRALKYNDGVPKDEVSKANESALQSGLANLAAHIENIKNFNLPCVVAINKFAEDLNGEIEIVEKFCLEQGVEVSVTEIFEKGGGGGTNLAEKVILACENTRTAKLTYDDDDDIEEKILKIAQKVYGAKDVKFSELALKNLVKIKDIGASKFPICMAKTPYSLSDNPTLLNRPTGFTVEVSDIYPRMAAGFLVVTCGNILEMPGLPKKPAAENVRVENREIVGIL